MLCGHHFLFFFAFFFKGNGSLEVTRQGWSCRVEIFLMDSISEKFRGTARVGCVGDEARLLWSGRVQKRDGEYIRRGNLRLKLTSRRSVERSKKRFMDGVKGDENLVGVREDDQRGGLGGGRWLAVVVSDRTVVWRQRSDRAETSRMDGCI